MIANVKIKDDGAVSFVTGPGALGAAVQVELTPEEARVLDSIFSHLPLRKQAAEERDIALKARQLAEARVDVMGDELARVRDQLEGEQARLERNLETVRKRLLEVADEHGIKRGTADPPLTSMHVIDELARALGQARRERDAKEAECAKAKEAIGNPPPPWGERTAVRVRVAELAKLLLVTDELGNYSPEGSWVTTLLLDAMIESVKLEEMPADGDDVHTLRRKEVAAWREWAREKLPAEAWQGVPPAVLRQLIDALLATPRDVRHAATAEARAAEWQGEAEASKKLLELTRRSSEAHQKRADEWRSWARSVTGDVVHDDDELKVRIANRVQAWADICGIAGRPGT